LVKKDAAIPFDLSQPILAAPGRILHEEWLASEFGEFGPALSFDPFSFFLGDGNPVVGAAIAALVTIPILNQG
jgi:hypothetical protein